MIILILIILLFFNMYLKQINSSFYTTLLLFVLIINELYFSKIEKFANVTQPANPLYRFDYDFKQNMNKQMCLFEEQQQIMTDKTPIKSKCHKIFNRSSCDMYRDCEYDTEFNRCNDKNKCSNIDDTEPLQCHYMDNKNICNILAPKIPKCDSYKYSDSCNDNSCKWNEVNKKCEYKDSSCVSLTEDTCSNKDNQDKCKWEYYNDIYNAEHESETNIVQCHSIDLLNISGRIPSREMGITETEIPAKLKTYFDNNGSDSDIYYGIQKNENETYNIFFLNMSNLNTISSSVKQNYECLNGNKYVGNNNHVMIYKKRGKCNTQSKCNWNIEPSNNCNQLDTQTCLDNNDCYYEYNSNQCLSKGFCESNDDNAANNGDATFNNAANNGYTTAANGAAAVNNGAANAAVNNDDAAVNNGYTTSVNNGAAAVNNGAANSNDAAAVNNGYTTSVNNGAANNGAAGSTTMSGHVTTNTLPFCT